MTSYTRSAAISIVILGISGVLANVLAYVLRLLLAREFSVETYGLIYAIMAFFGLVSIFQHLGFGEALTKRTASLIVQGSERGIKESILWALGLLSLSAIIIGGAFIIFAPWLSSAYFHDPFSMPMLSMYAAAFMVSPIIIVLSALLQGYQRMELVAALQVLQPAFLLIITWSLLSHGGIAIFFAYWAFYMFLLVAFAPFVIVRLIPSFFLHSVRLHLSTPRWMIMYGFPVMLTSIAGLILSYTDTVLLTYFSGLETVGIYQAAVPTNNLLLFVSVVLGTVLFPLIAELWQRKRKDLAAEAIHESLKYAFVMLLPAVLAVAMFPDFILNLLFGASYIPGAPILRLLAFSALFLTLHAINAAALSGIGTPKDTTKAVFIGAGMNLVGNLLLIPRFGGLGAAISTLFSSFVIFAASSWFLRRDLRVILPLGCWTRAIPGALVFLGVLSGFRFLGMNQYVKVAFAMLVGGTIYVGCLFIFRAVRLAELKIFKDRIIGKS